MRTLVKGLLLFLAIMGSIGLSASLIRWVLTKINGILHEMVETLEASNRLAGFRRKRRGRQAVRKRMTS